ncbi:MAG: hypothetical protein RBS77_05395 [Candidatus Moranbacteria bacterium]|jgi:xanthine/uracil permease|nr:hypothetical protein [Candidatus Moranbacteria bacterium]
MKNKAFGKQLLVAGFSFLGIAFLSIGLASYNMTLETDVFNADIFLALMTFGLIACAISLIFFRFGLKKIMPEQKIGIRIMMIGAAVFEIALLFTALALFNIIVAHNPMVFSISLFVALILGAISVAFFVWGFKKTLFILDSKVAA